MPSFYITVREFKMIPKLGSWDDQNTSIINSMDEPRQVDDPQPRCIAKVDNETVASGVCKALIEEYPVDNEAYLEPVFEFIRVDKVSDVNAARWESHLEDVQLCNGDIDAVDETKRDAAYHQKTKRLERKIGERMGLLPLEKSAGAPAGGMLQTSEADLNTTAPANGDAGTASQTGEPPKGAAEANPDALSGEAKALALLVQHPEWSDTKIAKAVPCHRTSLYKWNRYTQARAALKSGKSTKPKGSKSGETGDVEAWESDDS